LNDLGCNDFGLGGQTRPISRPQQAECQWLAKLGRRQTDALRMISISGDSMVPLLEHDDTVMLDYSQTRPSPPGIFILDDGVGLVAKRIEIIPSTTPQMLRISSENSAYSSYQRRIDEVHIIGRVVWFARRL
jgi:phage repressor protein C with HTH and peptisase S24 domain